MPIFPPRGTDRQTEIAWKAIRSAISTATAGFVTLAQLTATNAAVSALQRTVAALTLAGREVYKAAAPIPAFYVFAASGDGIAVLASSASTTIVGITLTTAAANASVSYAREGETIINSVWQWAVGQPVYCDAGGAPTQTLPQGTGIWQVGIAVTTSVIYINPLPITASSTTPAQPYALSRIPAMTTATVAADSVLLWASSLGLVLEGDLDLIGDLVEVPS